MEAVFWPNFFLKIKAQRPSRGLTGRFLKVCNYHFFHGVQNYYLTKSPQFLFIFMTTGCAGSGLRASED